MTITANYDDILKTALENAKYYKGMNRREVAEKSGVSTSAIDNWLARKSEPSIHLLTAVVNACGYQLIIKLSDL